MRFKKAIIEQSKEELDAYTDNMKYPKMMYNPTDGEKSNAAETTITAKSTDPDNEQLVVQIERACMLNNFEQADKLLRDNYDKMTLHDINRLAQFSQFIKGDGRTIRAVATRTKKPDYEKFGPRFIKSIQKKLSPR